MLRKLFFYFLRRWFVGTHESTFFIMRTHWNAINDFMMGKYFHKCLYEYYPQRPVRFVDFLANPSDQTYFFKESSLYVYYLLLVISLFFKVYIFSTSTANVILPAVSYGTSSSFRLQKETNCLYVNK